MLHPVADYRPRRVRLHHVCEAIGSGTGGGTAELTDYRGESGLKAAFFALRPMLIRLLRAQGAADDAEDLAQELFLKLDTATTGPVDDPRAYLCRMASNLLLDRRRSSVSRSRREQEWGIGGKGSAVEIDDEPSAEDRLIARERLKSVSAALAALPERTVAIFHRFRLDGETQRAIADDLGISLSAVEKHLQRAYRSVIDAKLKLDVESTAGVRHTSESETNRA